MFPMATAQLELISGRPDWKLDRQTIEVGRAGIAKARAALELATERVEAKALATETAVARHESYQVVTQLTIDLPVAA